MYFFTGIFGDLKPETHDLDVNYLLPIAYYFNEK